MEGCVLQKDPLTIVFNHCTLRTRVALASTCRTMRTWFGTSPLVEEWASLSRFQRWTRAIELNEPDVWHFYYNFQYEEHFAYTIRFCIWYNRLHVLQKLIRNNSYIRHLHWDHLVEAAHLKRKEICASLSFAAKKFCLQSKPKYPHAFVEGAAASGDQTWLTEAISLYGNDYRDELLEHLITRGLLAGGHTECTVSERVYNVSNLRHVKCIPHGKLVHIEQQFKHFYWDDFSRFALNVFDSNRLDVIDLFFGWMKKKRLVLDSFVRDFIIRCAHVYKFEIFLRLYNAGGFGLIPVWLSAAYQAGRLDIIRYIVEFESLLDLNGICLPDAVDPQNDRLRQYVQKHFSRRKKLKN